MIKTIKKYQLIKNFLILTPSHIVRMENLSSEYSVDRVWPEALLCTDQAQAESLAAELNAAYVRHYTHKNVLPFHPYKVVNYTDRIYYELVHRVPMSLRNLERLHEETELEKFSIETL